MTRKNIYPPQVYNASEEAGEATSEMKALQADEKRCQVFKTYLGDNKTPRPYDNLAQDTEQEDEIYKIPVDPRR